LQFGGAITCDSAGGKLKRPLSLVKIPLKTVFVPEIRSAAFACRRPAMPGKNHIPGLHYQGYRIIF